ncbi:ArsR/SmtB family transcription factor [Paenibacillus lutimineralis]|uniref:ArsR family transcriptional regulator n=1 Tax=Paenibacillus lutimineralis TaxID=2707005 RepID=A0A3Q9I8B1_9BACL|nr:winged helix-turn-helix domain-containing protein [Paenibacillus lutimineralis]AZS14879.1 ArsR family transcriptional regulator [Paenibacillus lutimineralis]
MNKEQSQFLDISLAQAKLLGSAQRIKIIRAMVDTAKTSKQVADELGESPGSIHYHIQKLYEGGLIDLVNTRTVGGIVEKYYQSKAKWFNTRGANMIDPVLADGYEAASATKISLRMQLSPEQREEMLTEFRSLLEKWVTISSTSKSDDTEEYAIGVNVVSAEKLNQ